MALTRSVVSIYPATAPQQFEILMKAKINQLQVAQELSNSNMVDCLGLPLVYKCGD
jgi:hypothetical protein